MRGRKYTIEVKQSAQKEIEAISNKRDRQRVVKRIAALVNDPRPQGCMKLSGREAYRVRQSRYRINYTIEDAKLIVEIVKIGSRRSVYSS